MTEIRQQTIDYEAFALSCDNTPVPTLYCDLDARTENVNVEVDMGRLIGNLKEMKLSDTQINNLNINLVNSESIEGDYGTFDEDRTIQIELTSHRKIKKQNKMIQETLVHEVSHYKSKRRDRLKDFIAHDRFPVIFGLSVFALLHEHGFLFGSNASFSTALASGVGSYLGMSDKGVRKFIRKKLNPEKTAKSDEKKYAYLEPSIWLVKNK